MKTIRQSVFETNSSSTHSVTIATGYDTSKMKGNYKDVDFVVQRGEFGWETYTHSDFYTKLEYAYTLAAPHYWDSRDNGDYLEVTEDNRELTMLEKVLQEELSPNSILFKNNDGYVDHQSQDNILDIFMTETTLKEFLFNGGSEIETGNDNDW